MHAVSDHPLILLVDDSPEMLFLLKKHLRALGAILTAANGADALATAAERNPDLILLDLIMPDMDGYEVCRRLKEREVTRYIPVIFVTSLAEAEDEAAGFRAGAVDFIPKPFNIDILLARVETQLALKRQRDQLLRQQREMESLNERLAMENAGRRRAEAALQRANLELEDKVQERQRQLLQADKMASLGVLVAGVAHEVNNPNHVVLANTGLLRRVWREAQPILDRYFEENGDFLLAGREYSAMRPKIVELFSQVQAGSERIRDIVEELKNFARERPSRINGRVSLNSVVKSAATLLASMLKKAVGERVEFRYAPDLPDIMGDYHRLEQVLINLLQNSCQAMEGREGALIVSTEYDPVEDVVTVTVADEGEGVAEEDLPRIMDPFFTTKRDRGGTGLGLSISAGIAADHGGRLEFSSTRGTGTTTVLVLPRGGAAGGGSRERRQGDADRRRSPR